MIGCLIVVLIADIQKQEVFRQKDILMETRLLMKNRQKIQKALNIKNVVIVEIL